MKKFAMLRRFLLIGFLVFSVALVGCEGDDGHDGSTGATGATGATGPAGPAGPPGAGVSAAETCDVCHDQNRVADVAEFHGLNAVIGSITVSAIVPTITVDAGTGAVTASVAFNFAAADANGNPVTVDLRTPSTTTPANLNYIRFALAKLVPGTNGDPNSWFDYVNNQRVAANLVGNPATGNYTYTFTTFDAATSALYDPTTTTRVGMQISGLSAFGLPVANPTFDFVPNGNPITLTRNIVTTAACNQCHDPLALHGGGRIETMFCVVCHNPTLAINPDGVPEGDFAYMVHKIHDAGTFTVLDDGISYAELTYPQDLRNCSKCHNGPDGDNWMTVPSMTACASCHNIVFSLPVPAGMTLHSGGTYANNSQCTLCHPATGGLAGIVDKHTTDNATVNNPQVPLGAVNFTYEISAVTVNASNQAVVVFRILADGTPVTFGAAGTTLLTGFTGSPSFLVAYVQPQDGITAPTEYNNLGKTAAQPASVSITNIWNGTQGTLAGPDATGNYTATLTSAAAAFPAGATMRAVGLQGYFTQVSPAVARHTRSVVMAVTGDAKRRDVVKSTGCAECHEIIEAHGGNRVLTAAGGVEICLMCHVPNLSSSGRGADPANIDATNQAALIANGYDPTNPLTFPEATNNFKDLIHGIHSSMSTVRTTDYEFVRDRGTSGVFYYNWSEVTYPGTINNCTKCHIGNSYRPENVPAGALVTTNVTTNGTVPITQASVLASRASVPNATDDVTSKLAATCTSCHTAEAVIDHTKLNGAAYGTRSDVTGQ